jgi:hypothetical protein
MASPQDEYLQTVRQSQEAIRNAVESWTRAMQQTFGHATSTTGAGSVDVNEIVDQVFNFAVSMLETQRQFAKGLVGASTSAVESQQSSSRA